MMAGIYMIGALLCFPNYPYSIPENEIKPTEIKYICQRPDTKLTKIQKHLATKRQVW